MAPVTNARYVFSEIPTTYPVIGKTNVYDATQTIDLENVPLKGGLLVKTLVLSLDPYMRGRMRQPEIQSYLPAYTLGEPLNGYGVGVVIRSESPKFKSGDHLYGIFLFQEYNVFENAGDLIILKNEAKLPWTAYVGPLGMPGRTAYFAWRKFAQPQKGDVVFVTSGAGIVGSLVCQFAKQAGLRVIASTGSDDKVEYLKELKVDVPFNYKTGDTDKILAEEGPINIYWDNVGGSTLDSALSASAPGARFIESGMITEYNSDLEPYHLKNLFEIVAKRLSVNGFLVTDLEARHPEWEDEFYQTVSQGLVTGKLIFREDITKGLDKVGEGFDDLLRGRNQGKAVVVVAEE